MSSIRTATVAAALLAPLVVAAPAGATHAGSAPHVRDIADACPASRVQPAHFDDVTGDNVHAPAIDCVAWYGVAAGRGTGYGPGDDVSRGQMATFLRNLVERSGGTLAPARRDYYADDNGTVHEESINLVTEASIASGRPGGGFEPDSPVQRGQMATFLVNAYAARTGEPLPAATSDAFDDDDGTTHEDSTNQAAEAGFVAGVAGGGYAPGNVVRRDAMASFLSRVLDLLVESGASTPPPDAAGDFALGFGSRGTATVPFDDRYAEANDVAEAPDGKVVAAGFVSREVALVRLTADGALDPTFGEDGRVTTPVGVFATAMGVAVQPDGKVVIGGRSNPSSTEVDADFLLARYTADGELDPTFGGDGLVTSSFRSPADVTELVLQPDGAVLVGGSGTNDPDTANASDMLLERYLPTGELDTSFGGSGRVEVDVAGGPDFLDGLALQPDGRIVAAGTSFDAAAVNEESQATVVRLLPNGTLDSGFGSTGVTRIDPGPFAQFTGVALQSDGSLVATGRKTNDDRTVRQIFTARFTPSGVLDAGFGDAGVVVTQAAPQEEASDVTVDADDRILVVGRGVEDANENGKSWVVLRYLPDGELDDASSGDGVVRTAVGRSANAVTIGQDGTLLVAGCDCPEPAFGRGGSESSSSMLVSRFRTQG